MVNNYLLTCIDSILLRLRKKELGNFSMAQDDHTAALSTYNHAKEIIDQATSSIDASIKVAIWNNMAACYLKVSITHVKFPFIPRKIHVCKPQNCFKYCPGGTESKPKLFFIDAELYSSS